MKTCRPYTVYCIKVFGCLSLEDLDGGCGNTPHLSPCLHLSFILTPFHGPAQCCVCQFASQTYGNWASPADTRLSSLLQPARGWEYTLSSSLDGPTGDSSQHNSHWGHITGPLVQLFHLEHMPLAWPWFIQPIPFVTTSFLSEIILSDYNVSAQKSIGLVQKSLPL